MRNSSESRPGAPRHFHLIGIGGTAMASLAGLLRAAGHRVTGSDQSVYPPMSDQLRELGIEYAEGYSPANLEPRPEIVVVGNAISRGNPELEEVLNRKIPYTSAAATLKEEFLRGRHVLAVAGTHGKTTTTSILAWVLEAAGLNPSFLVGGIVENFGASFRLTDSEFFVIEADEYDTAYFDKGPKMWHYLPQTAILNNVEFDHADIYRDEEAYRFAFARFVNLIPGNGTLIAGWDSPLARELAACSWAPVHGFAFAGEGEGASEAAAPSAAPEISGAGSTLQRPPLGRQPRWEAVEVEFGERLTRFRVRFEGEEWGGVETPLAGAFNVRNCLAAIAAAEAVGADRAGVIEGLRTFRSVRRRMEVRGEARGVTVIDDFAHHPTAVRETIDAARQRYSGRPLVAVFEPRSYTAQRREFQDAYLRAFGGAASVVLAGLFHPERYAAGSAMDPHALIAALRDQGKRAAYIPQVDDIVAYLDERLQGGEVVLVMSNGGFGGIHGKLLDALRG
jgi:UDP-N-acetylmuramate: L-alanyl-gamma-D-glutamyl-meso-diaminopimelate ligase